jgi:hypothetical protein
MPLATRGKGRQPGRREQRRDVEMVAEDGVVRDLAAGHGVAPQQAGDPLAHRAELDVAVRVGADRVHLVVGRRHQRDDIGRVLRAEQCSGPLGEGAHSRDPTGRVAAMVADPTTRVPS